MEKIYDQREDLWESQKNKGPQRTPVPPDASRIPMIDLMQEEIDELKEKLDVKQGILDTYYRSSDRLALENERLRELETAAMEVYAERHTLFDDPNGFHHTVKKLGRYFPAQAYEEFKARNSTHRTGPGGRGDR